MNAVEILKSIGRPNAYYPSLAKPFGSVGAAVLFSQLFYWQDKATSNLGVYKTRDELEEETGLTHNEQRTAIKKLKDKGVLIVTEKRLDHKTFYKINNEKVNEVLSNFAKSNNETPPPKESELPEVDNAEIGEIENSGSYYQETTTKTTSNKKINKKELDLSKLNEQPTDQVWDDYLEFRKSKRANLTQSALNALINQINLCNEKGIKTDEILSECMLRGWQGFKAEWILKSDVKNYQNTGVDWHSTDWADQVAEVM